VKIKIKQSAKEIILSVYTSLSVHLSRIMRRGIRIHRGNVQHTNSFSGRSETENMSKKKRLRLDEHEKRMGSRSYFFCFTSTSHGLERASHLLLLKEDGKNIVSCSAESYREFQKADGREGKLFCKRVFSLQLPQRGWCGFRTPTGRGSASLGVGTN
jgi:hypothetical protein